MRETIGDIIKKLRKERGLTQEALAEQLNISSAAVSKWENNIGMPDISNVVHWQIFSEFQQMFCSELITATKLRKRKST